MPNVNASVIIEDAERMLSWDITQLEDRQEAMARQAFSLALQEVWEGWWWNDLMVSEALPGAAMYDAGTTYAADSFVYYPASRKFYQAMQGTTGNAPAVWDAASNGYVTNYAYWALAQAAPMAADYDSTASYSIGDQVRSLVDGKIYQCISFWGTNLIPFGSNYNPIGIPANSYLIALDANAQYLLTPGVNDNYAILPDHTFLYLTSGQPVQINTTNAGNLQLTTSNSEVLPVTAIIQGVSISAPPSTNWHKLNPFTPSVALGGTVRAVGHQDLTNSPNAGQVDFEPTQTGIRIPGWTCGVPWLWYRRPTPIITGDPFDATATYTAAPNLTFP
jgi:hypothetical protein